MRNVLSGAVTLVVLAGGSLVATASMVVDPLPRVASSRFVPPGGHVEHQMIAERLGTTSTFRGTGFAGIVGTVSTSALERSEDLGTAAASTDWWLDHHATVDPRPDQRREVLRSATDRGIMLHTVLDGGRGAAFAPALQELPADPDPGQEWTSSGMVSVGVEPVPYEYRASIVEPTDPPEPGCIEARGELTIDGAVSQAHATYCPGRGLVDGAAPLGPTVTPALIDLTPPEAEPDEPVELRESASATQVVPQEGDAVFGYIDRSGLTQESVVFPSGTVLGTHQGEVIRSYAQRGHAWLPGWSVAPRGRMVGLTVMGQLAVVTDTGPEVFAIDEWGRQQWRTRLPDIPLGEAVRLDDTTLIVASVTGDLTAHDLITGEQRWHQNIGQVDQPPIVLTAPTGPLVMAQTSDDELVALGPDGTERWRIPAPERTRSLAIVGDQVVQLSQAGSVSTLAVEDGEMEVYSLAVRAQGATELFTDADAPDRVFVVVDGAVVVLDASTLTEVARHRRPATSDVVPGVGMVTADADGIHVLGPEGEPVQQWPLPKDADPREWTWFHVEPRGGTRGQGWTWFHAGARGEVGGGIVE